MLPFYTEQLTHSIYHFIVGEEFLVALLSVIMNYNK